jgi:hypothetical protein
MGGTLSSISRPSSSLSRLDLPMDTSAALRIMKVPVRAKMKGDGDWNDQFVEVVHGVDHKCTN